jgi:hypothetical protein
MWFAALARLLPRRRWTAFRTAPDQRSAMHGMFNENGRTPICRVPR